MPKLLSSMLAMALCLVASVAVAQNKQVKIGWGPFANVPQISLAADKNLWKDEGLDVKIIPFVSGRASFEALLGGQLDFAIIAEFPAVIGAMRKQKFGILALMSQYKANRVISKSDIGFKTMADLAGKKIGTTVGTNVHFMLDNEMQKAGIKAEVVNASPPDLVPALVRGDVDAAVMFPTFYAGAKRALGDRYRELRTPGYSTQFLLVGSANMVDKNPKVVRGVLSALLKGEQIVKKDPAGSQQAVVRYVKGAQNLDAIKTSWAEHNHRMMLAPPLLDLMVREGKWIQASGRIKNVAPTAALFRPYFKEGHLKALAGDRVTLK